LKDLIQKQRNYFESQQTLELKFRVQQLTKLEQVLRSNESLLYEAIYNDFKKSKFETYASELGLVYHDIKEAKNKLHQWSRKQKVKTNFVNFPGSSYIIPEPLGVCLVIGAWN
jgi:aldehyde dehydrogenase (NAD+)